MRKKKDMKLTVGGLVFLTVMCVCVQLGQAQEQLIRKNAFVFNPVGFGLALAVGGYVDLDIEYQRALSRYVAFYLNPELLTSGYVSAFGLGVGLYFFPLGKYLNGLYLSAAVVPVFVGDMIAVGAEGVLGWQIVFRSGFVLGFGIGAVVSSGGGQFHLHLAKIGFAF
jgi:hypothetical protein